MYKKIKLSFKILVALVILFFVSLAILAYLAKESPLSLKNISPYVEETLSSIHPHVSVTMGESHLSWDNFDDGFSISVVDVTLWNPEKKKIASFPELKIGFSLLRLLGGNPVTSDLKIINPTIKVVSALKGEENAELAANGELYKSYLASLYTMLAAPETELPLINAQIVDAEFIIYNGVNELNWHIKEGYIDIPSGNSVFAELIFDINDQDTYVQIITEKSKKEFVDIGINFENLSSDLISDLFPMVEQLNNFSFTAKGALKMLLAENGVVSQTEFNISDTSLWFAASDYFPRKIVVDNIFTSGNIYNGLSAISVNDFSANVAGTLINAAGMFKNTATLPDIKPQINASVMVENFPVNQLEFYWPITLGKKVRKWVTTRIREGIVSKASATFTFKPEDFEQKPLPADSIDATIAVKGTNINFHDAYPNVSNAYGTVHFSGHSMDVQVDSADVMQSTLASGGVSIANLWQRPLQLQVNGNVAGQANDFIQFLEPSKRKLDPRVFKPSIFNIQGQLTEGKFDITLPIKKGFTRNEMNIDLSGKASDVSINQLHEGVDLTQAALEFLINDSQYSIDLDGLFNTQALKISMVKSLDDTLPFDKKILLNGNVSSTLLHQFGLPEIKGIDRSFTLDFASTENKGVVDFDAKADLQNAAIDIKSVGLSKPSGNALDVAFKTSRKGNGATIVKDITAKGVGINIVGDAVIGKNLSGLSRVNLKQVQFGKNNVSVLYEPKGSGSKLRINGQGIDLAPVDFGEWFSKNSSVSNALEVKLDVKHAYLKNDEVIKDFTIDVDCDVNACNNVNLYGKVREDNFIVGSLKTLQDRKALFIESDNAGAIINGLNISKNIRGGALWVQSVSSQKEAANITEGVIRVTKFRAVKTPLLGKLVTLASLKGFTDLLNGEGITFETFTAPYEVKDGIVTVHNATSSGSSIGITAEGTINTKTSELDLKGTLVPASTVNKLIGNIPLFGKIITGGENEALIASTYKIQGPYEDAKVSVNPLSMLAPGFLRKLFQLEGSKKDVPKSEDVPEDGMVGPNPEG